MSIPLSKNYMFILHFIAFILGSSCSKDSDVLKDLVLAERKDELLIGNFLVNDSFKTVPTSSIVLDVLSNDTFVNPDGVKIIQTSNPVNGEVVILDDKTLLYIPAGAEDLIAEASTSDNSTEVTITEEVTTVEVTTEESTIEEVIPEESTTEQPVEVESIIEEEPPSIEETPQTESFTYTTEMENEDETITNGTATVVVTIYPPLSKSELASRAINALYVRQLPAASKDPLNQPYEGEYGRILRMCENGNQGDIYGLDALQGVIALFEATGDKKYLNDFIFAITSLFEIAVPSSTLPQINGYNDSYLSWHGDRATSISSMALHEDGGQFQLYESRGFMSVSRMLWVMHNSPNLRGESTIVNGKTYQQHYDYILNFMELNFWEKWFSRNSLVYQHSGVDSASAWAYIGWHLWSCTQDDIYIDIYHKFNSNIGIEGSTGGMREHLDSNVKDATAYQWSLKFNDEPFRGRVIADHGHAARTVKFMAEDFTIGEKFYTMADMNALIKTIQIFWPTHLEEKNEIYYWLDGQFRTGYSPMRNFMPEGWINLGRFDQVLQNRFENMNTSYFVQDRTEGVHWAGMAYNRAYLENTVQYPENFKK